MTRKTAQMKAIEQVFRQTNRPLGIDEILERGQRIVTSLNQATVYRNVKRLTEDGLIKKINHPSRGALYERRGKDHHHHFHCRKCNCVYELPGCALKEKGVAPEGFLTEAHEIFLFGVCPSCVNQ
jgi:Fur family ferric uptake transcriptional regulator